MLLQRLLFYSFVFICHDVLLQGTGLFVTLTDCSSFKDLDEQASKKIPSFGIFVWKWSF
jgi:hypothetical protein